MNTTVTTLELTDSERELLLGILDETAADLRVEIRRTRTPDYHDRLKEKGRLLAELIEKVRR